MTTPEKNEDKIEIDEFNDEEKKKVTYLQKEEDEKDDWKMGMWIIIFIVGTIFLIIVILIAILVPILMNKNKTSSSSQESSYVIDENTENRYSNLLSYINIERNDLSLSEAKEIVSLQYIDDAYLDVSYKTETNPGYIRIEITGGVNAALDIFKESVPTLGTYTTLIQNEENDNKPMIVNYENMIGMVSKIAGSSFISYTAKYDENTLLSLTHAPYSDEGIYEKETKVSPVTNKTLYDFYYYLLNNYWGFSSSTISIT